METLHNGYTLTLCEGAFPLSTDSIALADFVRFGVNARILDLGSGCGTLGLLLCAKRDDCLVTGIELDEHAHSTAIKNAETNGLSARLNSICNDLTQVSTYLKAGSFDICVSNPPYYSGGAKSKSAAVARSEIACNLEELITSASWALRWGGDLFLVHKPERLAEIFALADRHGLAPKTLCLIRHKSDSPVSLVLVQCRKGGKHGLVWQEQALYDRQGNPTDYYRKLYHQQEAP